MKCNNCGFNNDPNNKKCIKCNEDILSSEKIENMRVPVSSAKTLNGQQVQEPFIDQSARDSYNNNSGNNYAKTLLGDQAKESYIDRPVSAQQNLKNEDSLMNCPACGYQVMSSAKFCPNCNDEIKVASKQSVPIVKKSQDFKGTIDPFSRKGFSLRPIVNGEPGAHSLEFGGTTELNRENTIKDNLTITSKVQAEIKLENGEWFLTDRSEKKTTFIQAGEPFKLNKGDIILLGDTKFIFE